MEYTIQKLAKLANISTRTLRYYDEIGLLRPARINTSGYRIYGRNEVDRLQQILFYRILGISLADIQEILSDKNYDVVKALQSHYKNLLEKRKQLDILIANVEKTIQAKKGGIIMSDSQKFEGFKQKLLAENEKKYGEDIRNLYGKDVVEKSNKKIQQMNEEEYNNLQKLAEEMIETLRQAYKTQDPSSALAQKAADLHRQWLCGYWDSYSKEAHFQLAEMYVQDQRFTDYYDQYQTGLTKFLRDSIRVYTQ